MRINIIDPQSGDAFFTKDLENLETNIKNIRSEIINLKVTYDFSMVSRATYKDIQNQIAMMMTLLSFIIFPYQIPRQ